MSRSTNREHDDGTRQQDSDGIDSEVYCVSVKRRLLAW